MGGIVGELHEEHEAGLLDLHATGRSTGEVELEPGLVDAGEVCVSKADDLIFFLSLVMLQQGFPSRLAEALQRGLESPSGHRPTECGALAEVQLVQDTFLGQIEKQLPLALQVKGGTPTCWA